MPSQSLYLRLIIDVMGRLFPNIIANWIFSKWVSTRRFPLSETETEYRAGAQCNQMTIAKQKIATYRWGEGDPILLVHGWNGQGLQLGAFVAPLLRCGYSVIGFDAPGHGGSAGSRTDLFEIANVIQCLSQRYGPFAGIIAHSFGVPCTTYALNSGLNAKAVVLISGPADFKFLVQLFAEYFKLTPKLRERLNLKIMFKYGEDIWQKASAEITAKDLSIPALIIHDRNDANLPWQHAERITTVLKNSQILLTKHLGHRRILDATEVSSAVTEFFKSQIKN